VRPPVGAGTAPSTRDLLRLLSLAVGIWLQVMAAMMEAEVAAVCGPKGGHDPSGPRCGAATALAR
jgi:hypothetical protein